MHRERRRWFFDLSKQLVWRLVVSLFCIISFGWHWINKLSEFFKLFQCIIKYALFSRPREMNFNDEVNIFTVTVGYFKKCLTLPLQWSRFCESVIIFEKRKGYNFKEWRCTSLYLNSKIDKTKLNMAVFYPLTGDRATSRSSHFNKKTRYFGADPPAQ